MINILLSTYNGERYIEEQLQSIWDQDYEEYHLYIRDDGSTDNTVNVIKQFITTHNAEHKITLFSEENIGFCQSFGKLIEITHNGDYWAFCDQDDVWLSYKLSYAMERFADITDDIPILYHGAFVFTDQNLNEIINYIPQDADYDFRKSITCSLCYGFTCVFNKALYELLRKVDYTEVQSHDWFATMVALATGKVVFDDRLVAKHRRHENNESPFSFVQKFRKGKTLLKGKTFYTRNCIEFQRCFADILVPDKRKWLSRFTNKHYSFANSVYKATYPKRWNNSLIVDGILRCLMLIGKV